MKPRTAAIALSVALGWGAPSYAKVTDPRPVTEGNVVYRSHGNHVEAIDRTSQQRLWKTEVYEAGYVRKLDPNLETDVQMNIINTLRLQGEWLYIRNGKGEVFLLNKTTGKVQER